MSPGSSVEEGRQSVDDLLGLLLLREVGGPSEAVPFHVLGDLLRLSSDRPGLPPSDVDTSGVAPSLLSRFGSWKASRREPWRWSRGVRGMGSSFAGDLGGISQPPNAPARYHYRVLKGMRRGLGGFDGRVWLLVGAMLVFRFGQGLYYPFSAIYFHNVVGIPLSLIGAGLGSLAAASVVSGLVSGPLSDRYGRKPLMLAALSGSAATFLAFASVGNFAGYLAASVAAGLVGAASFDAARNAMVADVTPPQRRSRAYGLVRVGGNVGWASGPMVAGLASASAGDSAGVYRTLFVGTAVLTALVMLSLAFAVRESLPARELPAREAAVFVPGDGRGPLRAALSDAPFVTLLAAGVLLYYVFTQDWQALPVYAKNFVGVPDGRIGLFLGANGVAVMALQLPVSALIDRGSKVGALLVGAALFAASSATLLLSSSFLGILVAFAGFFTMAEMVLEVAGASLAAEFAPERLRGTYLALFGACFGVSYGVSPVVAGSLLKASLPHVIWTVQLFAAALAAAGLVVLGIRRRGSKG